MNVLEANTSSKTPALVPAWLAVPAGHPSDAERLEMNAANAANWARIANLGKVPAAVPSLPAGDILAGIVVQFADGSRCSAAMAMQIVEAAAAAGPALFEDEDDDFEDEESWAEQYDFQLNA